MIWTGSCCHNLVAIADVVCFPMLVLKHGLYKLLFEAYLILGTSQKLEGGGGLVQTWGGPWFFMQGQKGGSNNLVHVIKRGALLFMQRCWGQGVNVQSLCSHSHSPVNIIWNTFFI